MEKENEIWKPVVGFEDSYEVSSFGRVRSLDRYVKTAHNSFRFAKGKILAPINDSKGYKIVQLGRNHKSAIHRLVAKAFIPNVNNYPCINHKDENPSNNHFENLEWCTYEYNNNYGTRLDRISHSLRTNGKTSSSVLMLNRDGEVLREYKSIMDAQDDGFDANAISKCCRLVNKFVTHKKYIWIYSKDIDKIPFVLERVKNKRIENYARTIVATNNSNQVQKEYNSINQASKDLGISVNQISKCCRGVFNQTNGYTFKYAE